MLPIIIFLILIIIILYIRKNKIHIQFYTFLKKGFKKFPDKYGLVCFTGKQGTGKTYSAIEFCISEKKRSNCYILTNVKSFNYFKDTIFIEDIRDIMKVSIEMIKENKPILIFYDEIFTILAKGGSLSTDVLSFISQLRKRGIYFITTAQEWSEINITFRKYCRYQVSCNMVSIPFTRTALLVNQINDAYNMKWNNELQEHVAPTIRTNISKGMKEIIDSYDTFETISVGKSVTTYRR